LERGFEKCDWNNTNARLKKKKMRSKYFTRDRGGNGSLPGKKKPGEFRCARKIGCVFAKTAVKKKKTPAVRKPRSDRAQA